MAREIALAPEVAKNVYFQSYAAQAAIEDVAYHPLTKHRALEGWFMEFMRLTDGGLEGIPVQFDLRQISFSKAVPHRINAFHLHPKTIQDEVWSVIDGTMMVWLVDCREGSPTFGVRRRYVLNGEAPGLLYIPTGVAHGYRSGPEGGLLAYCMNSQFDLDNPNEGRLPWDYFGPKLWEDDRG